MALSDTGRAQTYEFGGAPSLPISDFKATPRIAEVVDGDRGFVEWWADFDYEPARRDELTATLRSWFARWLESLRTALAVVPVPEQTGAAGG